MDIPSGEAAGCCSATARSGPPRAMPIWSGLRSRSRRRGSPQASPGTSCTAAVRHRLRPRGTADRPGDSGTLPLSRCGDAVFATNGDMVGRRERMASMPRGREKQACHLPARRTRGCAGTAVESGPVLSGRVPVITQELPSTWGGFGSPARASGPSGTARPVWKSSTTIEKEDDMTG